MSNQLPERMRVAVYKEKGRLALEERRVQEPGPANLLLRVSHCGVCGTDLHLVMEGWGLPGSIGGHEYSGTVVALGKEVDGFAVGDRVVGGPNPGCGECEPCRAGRPTLCLEGATPGMGSFQGAFAEYKQVAAAEALKIPEALDMRTAALAEPLAVALHGIRASGLQPGQRALVTGAGPIGMLSLAALRALGVEEVTVSEPGLARRELAAKVGATRVVAPEELRRPRMAFELVAEPFHAAIECSGQPSAAEAALAQLGRMGTLVLSGTGMERPRLDSVRVILNELVVTGAYASDARDFASALELLASGRLRSNLLIAADDVALEGLQAAMEALVAGHIGGKVMVAPEPA